MAYTDVCSLPAAGHLQLVTNLQVARQRERGTKCPGSSCLEKIPSQQLAGKKKKKKRKSIKQVQFLFVNDVSEQGNLEIKKSFLPLFLICF